MGTVTATSREAYENKKPTIQTDQDLILSVLLKDKGKTYHEISLAVYKKLLLNINTKIDAYAWKYNPNKVSRRLKELISKKRIKVLEERKCTLAKSTCQSYVKL